MASAQRVITPRTLRGSDDASTTPADSTAQAIARWWWIYNPNGCWDWWGYTGQNYATKEAVQIRAVLAHEFGHFSQSSMAVFRWSYLAQQIAAVGPGGHGVGEHSLDAVVDLAAMRDAMAELGGDVEAIDTRVESEGMGG